jgi:arylsulfatase A-like enzyme
VRRHRRGLVATALGLGLAAGACSRQELRLPVDNVVLVSIDSLRADHLGAYGYAPPTSPTIDALAETGVTFDRAYSTTSWTLPSHISLLTGLENLAHGVVHDGIRLSESVETLAESLGAAGIRTAGFFSGPYLHPAFGLAQGFDDYVDCRSQPGELSVGSLDIRDHLTSHQDVTNPILLEAVREWLREERPGRNFVFIHMWDVHYDYVPPAAYVGLFDPDYTGSVDGRNYVFNDRVNPEMRPRDLQHILALYDGEIRYTDDTLGSLLEALREAGLLDNAAVVVTADHGEEFFEHGKKGHRNDLYEELVRVPLVLNIPGFRPRRARVDDVVSLVDLRPTICELFGVPCAPRGAGASLLSFLRDDPPAPRGDALAELTRDNRKTQLLALIRSDDKTIVQPRRGFVRYIEDLSHEQEGPKGRQEQLVDSDPRVRDILAQLRSRAEAAVRLRQQVGGGDTGPPALDPELRKRLESLGYVD